MVRWKKYLFFTNLLILMWQLRLFCEITRHFELRRSSLRRRSPDHLHKIFLGQVTIILLIIIKLKRIKLKGISSNMA